MRRRIGPAGVRLLAVELGTLVHALGHIMGGKLVGSPMDELLLTATRGVNLYHGDQQRCPPSVHLGRALGGPVLNLLAAALLISITPAGQGPWSDLSARAVSTNLFMGLCGLLPLPSVDGWVIWAQVLALLRRRSR